LQEHRSALTGHGAGLLCALIWGCTFISSKILLETFTPVEILFGRFLVGYILLIIINPRPIRFDSVKQELTFAGCGLVGVAIYYLVENFALTFTQASTVSIVTSSAPFFTGLFAAMAFREEKVTKYFFPGFVVSMIGITFLSLPEGDTLSFGFMGTLLSLAAAAIWGVYSVILKKTEAFGYGRIAVTRRTFFYGLLSMLPETLFLDFSWDFGRFLQGANFINILFLGIFASAVCLISWAVAIKHIGAVKASVYIYLMPAVTVAVSVPLLHEKIGLRGAIGMMLTLAGVVLSEYRPKRAHNGSAEPATE